MNMRSNLLTASRLGDARACQRLHKLKYIDGWRPVTTDDALRFGTLVHLGLEAWWSAASSDERFDRALEAMAGEADAYDRVRAEELLRGYDIIYANQPFEVLGVEVEFRAPLVNPETGRASTTWRLGGKLDAIYRDLTDGLVYVAEHKTSSEDIGPGSSYWRRLLMNSQVSIYHDGARALGFEPAGVLYDVIKKPTIRPAKATPPESRKYTKDGNLYANQRAEDESPEDFRARLCEYIAARPDETYRRGSVVRLEDDMVESRFDLWQVGQQLRESERLGRFPKNPDACVRYGRECPFMDVCSIDPSALADPNRFRRLDHVHPELAKEESHDDRTSSAA